MNVYKYQQTVIISEKRPIYNTFVSGPVILKMPHEDVVHLILHVIVKIGPSVIAGDDGHGVVVQKIACIFLMKAHEQEYHIRVDDAHHDMSQKAVVLVGGKIILHQIIGIICTADLYDSGMSFYELLPLIIPNLLGSHQMTVFF